MFVGTEGCAPCSDTVSYGQCMKCRGTHGLSHTLLTVSHEQVGDLLDYRVVAMLDVTVLWERQSRHLVLQTGCLLQ
jgi:hypothetical protein